MTCRRLPPAALAQAPEEARKALQSSRDLSPIAFGGTALSFGVSTSRSRADLALLR